MSLLSLAGVVLPFILISQVARTARPTCMHMIPINEL